MAFVAHRGGIVPGYPENTLAAYRQAIKHGAEAIEIDLWPKWIYEKPELVEKVHRLGRPAWTTANDAPREELEKLVRFGGNGILSDLPEVINQMLADMRKARGF